MELADISHLVKEDYFFDYSLIDPKFHAAEDPESFILLYKGAVRGREYLGFPSQALNRRMEERIWAAKGIIEGGDDTMIRELFDRHTSYYSYTPLLSATYNPESAQVFAQDYSGRDTTTIYRLAIQAKRCVFDCFDTGNCGASGELMILGAIFPEEITGYKIENSLLESELRSAAGRYVSDFPRKDSANRKVRNTANWKNLR